MTKALEAFSLFAKRWWPALLWMALILLASLDWASGGHTFPIIKAIALWFNPRLSTVELYDINLGLRKVCHFLQFLILALLVWRTRGSWRFVSPKADFRFSLFVLGVSSVLAVGSEFVQYFVSTRTSSPRDVLINITGALGGILIALAIEAIFGRETAASPSAKAGSSRILLTADLHLDSSPSALAEIRQAIEKHQPDLLVVAGNICSPVNAAAGLRHLKEVVGHTPLVFCLGNQDHWLPLEYWPECPSPAAIREKFWRPAALQTGVACLDFANFEINGLAIAGGYGHFDLEFRDQTLRLDNRTVTREDYLAGALAGLECRDMSRIPHAAATLPAEAATQAVDLATRLTEAAGKGLPVLLVTGTAPFCEWSGDTRAPGSILNFFQAYAGNSQLQPVILAHAQSIRLAVCGCTHAPVATTAVCGIRGLNIGNHQDGLRFALFETGSGDVRFV